MNIMCSQRFNNVAPLVGAWIEMIESAERLSLRLSLLSWERGLKYINKISRCKTSIVAPLVGAWIEIVGLSGSGVGSTVAPLVGAWIEM